MARIHIICEGQTEETFIKELLAPHFELFDIFLQPALIGKPGHKGGAVNFDRMLTDCRLRLLGDQSSYCSTFFDFYALPTNFPGKEEAAQKRAISEKAECVEVGLKAAIQAKIGETSMYRFIPYVQMYEYEGLLFSDPERFAYGIDRPALAGRFQTIRDSFPTPEDINDSPITAPSKRIINIIPGYEKPLLGTLAALEIGLEIMRSECALFDAWLKKLEALQEKAS